MTLNACAPILTPKNALLLADLLEKLPMDVYSDILEYNSEHRAKWNLVLNQLHRYVYCPFYFNVTKNENYEQREFKHSNMFELNSRFRCMLCPQQKEASAVLKQLKNGLLLVIDDLNDDILFCANCNDNDNNNDVCIGWYGRGRR